LLSGQISAGKSSFFNTVESAFSKHVKTRADAGNVATSLTTLFRIYKVKAVDKNNEPIAFQFCDTMGLSTESGLSPDDFGKIMDGHVEDGDNLDELAKEAKDKHDQEDEADRQDKMHAVVFLVDASRMSYMDEEITQKVAKIREQATRRILNPIVILTRIDECCTELHKDDGDIKQVFNSKTVRELVVEVTQKFGVAENMVFPVQNYSSELENEMGIDILMLRALRQILRCSETCVDDMCERDLRRQKKEKKKEAAKQEEEKKKEAAKQEKARLENLKHARANVETLEELNHARKNVERLEKSPNQAFSQKKRAPSRLKQEPALLVCRAIDSREGEEDGELNMVKGEKFEVLKSEDGNGWVEVKNNSGDTGLVPAEWIKMLGDIGTLSI